MVLPRYIVLAAILLAVRTAPSTVAFLSAQSLPAVNVDWLLHYFDLVCGRFSSSKQIISTK